MSPWRTFHDLLLRLLAWVEGFAATPYGDWALFALAFAESSFFPIPPDVLLIALAVGRPEASFWFATLCSAGSVIGAIAGYGIGYFGGRPLLRRLFRPEKIRAVELYYDRYNAWATGIAALTPVPYKVFTVGGGAFAIDFKVFVLASIIARSARFFAVAGLIFVFGEPIRGFIREYLDVLSIGVVAVVLLGYWLVGHGARRAVGSGGGAAGG